MPQSTGSVGQHAGPKTSPRQPGSAGTRATEPLALRLGPRAGMADMDARNQRMHLTVLKRRFGDMGEF